MSELRNAFFLQVVGVADKGMPGQHDWRAEYPDFVRYPNS
jgi:hypothetical protein